MAKSTPCIVTLSRNGKKIADINLNKFNIGRLSKAIDQAVNTVFANIKEGVDAQAQDILSMHVRERIDEATQLAVLYKEAINASTTEFGKSMTSMRFVDTSVLDAGTPTMYGAWWRIYEYGTPGSTDRVGGSTEYRFVPVEGAGKHGEGIMVKTKNPEYGHPGVHPFHVTVAIKSHLKSELLSGRFAERVLRYAVYDIGRNCQ